MPNYLLSVIGQLKDHQTQIKANSHKEAAIQYAEYLDDEIFDLDIINKFAWPKVKVTDLHKNQSKTYKLTGESIFQYEATEQ